MKKYEFVEGDTIIHEGRTLHRIRALKRFWCGAFPVHRGQLGGYIESELNLSHEGSSWVVGYISSWAKVYGEAYVEGNALVTDSAEVFDYARIKGDATVGGTSKVFGNVTVQGSVRIWGESLVSGAASIYGNALLQSLKFDVVRIHFFNFSGRFNKAVIKSPGDFLSFGGVGSENGTLTAYRSESGVSLTRGCFCGSLDQFVEAVQKRHGNTLIGKEYLAMVEIIKLRFGL